MLGYVFDIETGMAEEVVMDRERVKFEIKESLGPVSEKLTHWYEGKLRI